MANQAEENLAAEIRPLAQSLVGYAKNALQLASEAGLTARYGPDVVRAGISALLHCAYLRPGPGAQFHERAPLSAFTPNVGYPLAELLDLGGGQQLKDCAKELLSRRVIVITADDPPPTRYRGISQEYERTGALIAPPLPATLAEFGKTIDAIRSALNTYVTELFCSDVAFMMKLLAMNDRISASVAGKVKRFIESNSRHFPAGITDFNPFALKGGNVFKLTKFLLETGLGLPASLAGLSDHDFGINFPKVDFYYRACNERFRMSLPLHDEQKDARLRPDATRDAKYYELYSLIFSALRVACRDELAKLPELGQKHDELAATLARIFDDVGPVVELLDNETFYPLKIAREEAARLFMMKIETEADGDKYKRILGTRPKYTVDKEPTRYFRMLEMDIADYTLKRQGPGEEITKTGFRLARAQLSFNIRFSLAPGLSIDKILFAEIFDYATPFMYTHDICAAVDQYETIDMMAAAGVNVKAYSIPWFIGDILSMITGGVESPKHGKRILRIATLIGLVDRSAGYPGRERTLTYLASYSPRGYYVKDKLLELMDKYQSQWAEGSSDARTVAEARRILVGL